MGITMFGIPDGRSRSRWSEAELVSLADAYVAALAADPSAPKSLLLRRAQEILPPHRRRNSVASFVSCDPLRLAVADALSRLVRNTKVIREAQNANAPLPTSALDALYHVAGLFLDAQSQVVELRKQLWQAQDELRQARGGWRVAQPDSNPEEPHDAP